jgi:hypothetical protein
MNPFGNLTLDLLYAELLVAAGIFLEVILGFLGTERVNKDATLFS